MMELTDPPPSFPLPGLVSNPGETLQTNIIVAAVITWVIGAVFVGLRFYARAGLLHGVIGLEDWLMIVALIFSGATSAGFIEQASYGLGKHFLDIDPSVMLPMTRAGWYSVLWYMLSLLATKASICLLYLRVLRFRHARYTVWAILAAVLLANGVWTLYTVLTACVPLHAFWTFPLPLAEGAQAWCRPQRDWFANTGLHIATDALMYALPLPVVVALRVGVRQKMALYAVLALGLFVCLVSGVRLWCLTMQSARVDFSFDNVGIAYLTVIETNAAIVVACCMTLRPVVNRWFPRFWGSRSSMARQSRREGIRRDVEMGMHIKVGGPGRGPPTIGSTPLRKAYVRRHNLHDLGSLGEDDDSVGGAIRSETRISRAETDGTSFKETGSGIERAQTPTEPHPIYTTRRRDEHGV